MAHFDISNHPKLIGLLALMAPLPAAAETVTVDLGSPLHPVTRIASGALYGMIEERPADLEALVAPLRPKMYTNPAADIQQPWGDAIEVAERLAPLGASVTIRLADLFPGWPYQFTNMDDWFDLLQDTVSRKQASGLDNYYGYEIWNEPDGTWTSGMSFNDFWLQTCEELRRIDPGGAIIGPSDSDYDEIRMRSFLTFARDNDCEPDIISWHQLIGQNFATDFASYRALEQELGIGPLPISINEYSGADWIDDEGQPGASAPIIAKFERFGVDTACISYWDVPNAGRLGSLLATNTEPNGGWWFYKWYGDMSGDMVTTVAPNPNDTITVDGFANLDAAACSASVLLAGENDGTIDVVVQGFAAAGVFGASAQVTLERTSWTSRTTPSSGTETLEMTELPIENDSVQVTIPDANDFDGYRVLLQPAEDFPCPTDTHTSAGGTTGTGGGTATTGADGGSTASSVTVGGTETVTASSTATNGSSSAGEATSAGGATSGAVSAGGASATGSDGSTAGSHQSTAGSNASTTGSVSSGAPGSLPQDSDEDAGCSCRVAPAHRTAPWFVLLGLCLPFSVGLRRLRRRPVRRTLGRDW